MKRVFITLINLLIITIVFAQAPEKMNYQAVVRNATGELIVNKQIGVQISVSKQAFFPVIVYQETHTKTTNENGLITLEIGSGLVDTNGLVPYPFSSIKWNEGSYDITAMYDLTGGTNYTITSKSQLLSVPYALYAKTAATAESITPLTIGQAYQGGIIFWLDATGQHGLIAATADQSTGIHWYNGTYRYTGTTGNGLYAGAMNTAMIVATQMADNPYGQFAAKICADYSVTKDGITYGDWYLPSHYELKLLYAQRNLVGGFANIWYWSSTENNDQLSSMQHFGQDDQIEYNKSFSFPVRAIRAF